MADSSSQSPRSAAPAPVIPIRRAMTTGDESAQLRRRFVPPATEAPTPGVRRRSSNFSDYSLNEARKTFQSSTDDLLFPKPRTPGIQPDNDSSAWHSTPLAFALLPALGGMLFKNGSSVITDIMLLGLAAIFLNWSVRLPWDWYHSAQSIRKEEEYNGDAIVEPESEDDNALSSSQTALDEVPEDQPASNPRPKPLRRPPSHEAAAKELYRHELLALLSCFLFPVLGAYLLHTIRSQLSRPSEGLVSNYNLTIFLLASELRPMAHLVKLVQSRTLHLQRVVKSNPYNNERDITDVKDLVRRVEELEARSSTLQSSGNDTMEPALSGKQSAMLTAEVRRALQPDLDALNRAVRRYEKRATLQAFQTDSRLLDLEARLNDAISLAAAAANHGLLQRGFTSLIFAWAASVIALPFQALGAFARLPIKVTTALIRFGKTSIIMASPPPTIERNRQRSSNGKSPSYNRAGDRREGRVSKR